MEKTTQTYYASYRGYVYLYVPFEATDYDEALTIVDNMPSEPVKGQELIMLSPDLELELDYDYIPLASDCRPSPVPAKLQKAIVGAAINQAELRAERQKQAKVEQLTKQINDANAQLVTATQGITDQINKLKTELEELQK